VATARKLADVAQTKMKLELVKIQREHGSAAADLAQRLEKNIKGELRFDPASRSLYAADLSIYRQVPIGVVVPRDADDVMATVAACREFEAPILGRGCGTSLA
jgi:FAD/FMN-containing dehydrogenase